MIERLVAKRKARIHSLDGSNEATPDAEFMNGILDLAAAREVALIRARTRAALQAKKARNERVGKLPFGFQLSADGVHLEPCPDEQSILERINELRQAGYSLRKVADALNNESRFNRQGKPWNHVSLLTLCRDIDQRLAA
jgi:DNA invertase Pin-like site-specific DNA recombinase